MRILQASSRLLDILVLDCDSTVGKIKKLTIIRIGLLLSFAFGASTSGLCMEPLIQKGWLLIQSGHSLDAAQLFKQATIDDSKNVLAHRAYQTIMLNLGKKDPLRHQYETLLSAQPNSGMLIYLYSLLLGNDFIACKRISAGLHMHSGDLFLQASYRLCEAAQAVYDGHEDRALQLLAPPFSPGFMHDARLVRVTALMEIGRYDAAIREIGVAIDEMPFDPANYQALAGAYYFTAEYRKALLAARQAVEINNSPSSRTWLALLLKTTGRLADAKAEVGKIVAMQPSVPDDYGAIGWAYYDRGNTKRAWEYLDEWKKRSLSPESQSSLLMLELQLFGFKKARSHCDELLRKNPRNMATLLVSGLIYRSDKCQCDKAVADFDEILKINPKNVQALTAKAWAYLSSGRYEEASKTANQALKLAPDDWEVVEAAGFADPLLMNPVESANLLKRAIQLNPDIPDTYILLGETDLLLNHPENAEHNFELARQHPDSRGKTVLEAQIKGIREQVPELIKLRRERSSITRAILSVMLKGREWVGDNVVLFLHRNRNGDKRTQ